MFYGPVVERLPPVPVADDEQTEPTIGLARDFPPENVPGRSGPIRSVRIPCPPVTAPRTETRRFCKRCPVPISGDSRN